jgi:hypothetical protein
VVKGMIWDKWNMVNKIEFDVSLDRKNLEIIAHQYNKVHTNNESVMFLFANWFNNATNNSAAKDFIKYINKYYESHWHLDASISKLVEPEQ